MMMPVKVVTRGEVFMIAGLRGNWLYLKWAAILATPLYRITI